MDKLLWAYSFIGEKGQHCDYVERTFHRMEDDRNAYFSLAIPGQPLPFAGGALTLGENGVAIYVSSDGRKFPFSKDTPLQDIYNKSPGIRAAWDIAYGLGCPGQVCPFASQCPVILGDYISDTSSIIEMVSTPFIDASQCEYKDYVLPNYQALNLISQEVCLQFPDRKAQKLTLLAGGSRTGICPNYPTHNGLPPFSMDFQYYTFGDTSYTQKGRPTMNIWKDGMLDLSMFDAKRHSVFSLLFIEAFMTEQNKSHGAQILVWPDIIDAMLAHYQMESEEYKLLKANLTPDDNPDYNHNLHMHTYVREDINRMMRV